MLFISLLLFALAVSIDGFGVGFAYGMKNIIIPMRSLLIICFTSASAIAASMFFGQVIVSFIPLETARLIGALILSGIGLLMLIHAWVQRSEKSEGNEESKKETLSGTEEKKVLVSFKIIPLGILIQILKEPGHADMDKSGTIDVKEALILGVALAMDALAAGFAAAFAGFPPLWTALMVGLCKFIILPAAVRLGRLSANNQLIKKSAFIPGLLILILGLSKLR
ncbi:sporulation membrane protein YtaF [Dehalobacterium formicoaceticum]|uniref:sporulation membrane protein YtaF n=1 Tax=Dehalobacterium formicoaceticum TaxID=51515 RepID=UPI000B7DFE01|nr:sporulation membrane protein YtaF [Dehalobacterium formicoaceticum]